MPIVLDGTNGINTPDLESAGPISGTTGTFSGDVQVDGIATNIYPLVSGTAVASTSGTSIDFTGIPSWVRRITVMFAGVSTNGSSNYLVQVGAGSVTTSGYLGASTLTLSSVGTDNFTTGFGLRQGGVGGGVVFHGTMTISLINANTWVASGVTGMSQSGMMMFSGGSVALSGTLDRVRITTVNGTDTFDAGSINIMYE